MKELPHISHSWICSCTRNSMKPFWSHVLRFSWNLGDATNWQSLDFVIEEKSSHRRPHFQSELTSVFWEFLVVVERISSYERPLWKFLIVINKKNISRAPSLSFSCNLTTIFSRAPAMTVYSSYWLKIISWMPCMRIFNWNWPERFLRALSDNF